MPFLSEPPEPTKGDRIAAWIFLIALAAFVVSLGVFA